jgi:FkbH-like protein
MHDCGEAENVSLSWLPQREDWDERLRLLKTEPAESAAGLLRELADARMDFAQLARLDRVARKLFAEEKLTGFLKVRLAVLASSTTAHLLAGIRVAGLRRGLEIEVYATDYAAYRQELMDTSSALHSFAPEVVLFAFDARHVAAGEGADGAVEMMRACWRQAKAAFNCQVLQQTVLPVFPALVGNNEERLATSPATIVAACNESLRAVAEEEGVDMLALDRFAAHEGLAFWHDAGLWLHAKQEVHPRAAELYGEQAARVIAAGLGRSKKCLVLDLDNTLWGGVVGDDGVEGVVLGQGSAAGEAFVEFQRYAKQLSERGVLLAVCSKNDEANAREVFARHPEMVLKAADIAYFVANWSDKATNLRAIAERLNIGLDALVFVDDNPGERELVRRELPMVAVPEMPEDPAEFAGTIAAAGYFEALRLTEEDHARGKMYRAEAERAELLEAVGGAEPGSAGTDMEGYLRSLRMELTIAPVDEMSLVRATQLLNKTNQFNLTTVRHCEAEVRTMMREPGVIALQARLRDRFGDNGIIAVMILRVQGGAATVEEWVMSCRVLGRRVEEACLQSMVDACRARGVKRLTGIYRPTAKNAMVGGLYPRLGFGEEAGEASADCARWSLTLAMHEPHAVPMVVHVDVHDLREALV